MNKEGQIFDPLDEQCDNLGDAYSAKIEQLVNTAGIVQGDRVLSIGCDIGILIPCLKKAVGDVGQLTVMDYSPCRTDKAKEKYRHMQGVYFLAADIMAFHCDEVFSQIICFNSFPREREIQSFLIKLRGLLSGDGFLVIIHDPSLSFLPVEKTVELLENLSYLVVDVIDNDELYFVKACKR